MSTSTREFRTPESYDFEEVTRGMLRDFLIARGFLNVRDERKRYGQAQTQALVATSPSGQRLAIRVRLCWRRGEESSRGERTYSAAQLLARIKNGDWEGSIQEKIEREREDGITHLLLVQREIEEIVYAALVPLSEVLTIWRAQRDISERLIQDGQLGARTKNHAMNGSSPTLYLQDDRAPEVAAALWDHPGVRDLAIAAAVEGELDGKAGGGAGFGNPAKNKLVESTAVQAVTERYINDGWDVRSVEGDGCGFDLKCTKGAAVDDVEVKGVAGSEQSFIITAGEVKQARTNPNFVLIVVTSTLAETRAMTRYSGAEFLRGFDLSAVQYRAALRQTR